MTVGAEAQIIMCAVGSSPAQLGITSGAGEEPKHTNNNERCTELRSDLERLRTQS